MKKIKQIGKPIQITNDYASLTLEFKWVALSIIIGFTYITYMMGWDFTTNISNIQYISDDMQQHFLGWHFYRYDGWRWPLTITDRIRYPLDTSIVFTDSFPLLSTPLKAISGILPNIFIWHGLVAVINSALQFYFSSLIIRTLRKDNALAIIGGIFFVLSTAFAYRLFKHYTLTSHWLILWSLLLNLKPKTTQKELKQNLVLTFICCGIHAYILIINLFLSISLLYKYAHQNKDHRIIVFITEGVKLSVVLLSSLYIFGYFTLDTGSSGSSGWGDFSFNLNSWFNPINYSLFISGLPLHGPQSQETCQYLGLGVLIALMVAIINVIINKSLIRELKQIKHSQYFGLLLICILLFTLSISTVVTFNDNVILDISNYFTSDIFIKFFSTIRSSARLAWPLFYLITLFAILNFYDLFRKVNKKLAITLLSVLLVIQIADLFKLRQDLHQMVAANLERPLWNSDLTNPTWDKLSNYKHLVLLFPHQVIVDGTYESYYKFGLLAANNNLTINLFYLARGFNYLYQNQIIDFLQGNWRYDNIYIVPDQYINMLNPQFFRYCNKINNYNVCALTW